MQRTSDGTLAGRPRLAVAAMRHARGGTTATPEPSADHQLMAVLMDSPFPLQMGALGAVMGAFGSAIVRNEGSFRTFWRTADLESSLQLDLRRPRIPKMPGSSDL